MEKLSHCYKWALERKELLWTIRLLYYLKGSSMYNHL